MSVEEKFEALTMSYQTVNQANTELTQRLKEMAQQNDYLRKQVGNSLKQKQQVLESTSGSNPRKVNEEAESQHSEYEINEELGRTPRSERWTPTNSNDFRDELPEFEGKLDPDEFLEWLHTVERIFEYKEVTEEKKVKFVALRLEKYVSLRWTNLCNKRIRERKAKIQTWDQMKAKLKARFLPSSYHQDNYSQLHNLTKGIWVLMNTPENSRSS